MSSSTVININQLTETVNKILLEYGSEIEAGAKISAKTVGKETAKQLKRTSPRRKGNYAESWKSTSQATKFGSFVTIVFNDKYYRLTHLLEDDHYARNGKIVHGNPHIKPAEEQAILSFEKKIRGLI